MDFTAYLSLQPSWVGSLISRPPLCCLFSDLLSLTVFKPGSTKWGVYILGILHRGPFKSVVAVASGENPPTDASPACSSDR